ncbi:hypothetical protein [Solwaraspora sp. WMMD792]|uniref:hypothetical protein n=1 Tax=Solwaraspora sp. WMMD792 TaxID=3016099 RepID=UPI00241601CC|nr:hypothetical protein [Solwaraspora sp. WMMD792]MDG4770684.1 hypothetical protein [Solwaraspora sp. WMMD792]
MEYGSPFPKRWGDPPDDDRQRELWVRKHVGDEVAYRQGFRSVTGPSGPAVVPSTTPEQARARLAEVGRRSVDQALTLLAARRTPPGRLDGREALGLLLRRPR